MNDLDLEQRLATPHPERLGTPDLGTIRAAGTRRRRGRTGALIAAGGLALAAVVGVGLGLAGDGPGSGADRETTVYSPPEAPDQLSDLAARVLDEVPGAIQVSAGQVVIPGPDIGQRMDVKVDADLLAGAPVPLEAHTYTGVTAYPAKAFPAWLYDEVLRIEQEELGDEDGYPVGSTEMGILVETGNAELACMRPRASDGENMPGDRCFPTLVSEADGARTFQWGMGSDDFLEPGAEMELFTSDDYSAGSPSTVWIGGLDGTAVERVVFDLADGSTVDASVLPGTLVPGDTMFWANVEGEPTMVTAYDADGGVIDDHKISACSGGVDCEVR